MKIQKQLTMKNIKKEKILNKNWFEINEEQFWLYKDIAKYFKKIF